MTERPDIERIRRAYHETGLMELCDAYERLEAERDEARRWAVETVEKVRAEITTTCVWCGHQFAPQSKASEADELLAHAKECDKHPVKAARALADRLAEALQHTLDTQAYCGSTPCGDCDEAAAALAAYKERG